MTCSHPPEGSQQGWGENPPCQPAGLTPAHPWQSPYPSGSGSQTWGKVLDADVAAAEGLPTNALGDRRPRARGAWILRPCRPGAPLAVPAPSQPGAPDPGQVWAGLSSKSRGSSERGQDVSPSLGSSLTGTAKTTDFGLQDRGVNGDSSRMGMVPGLWGSRAGPRRAEPVTPCLGHSRDLVTVPGWTPGLRAPSREGRTLRLLAAQLRGDAGSGHSWNMGTGFQAEGPRFCLGRQTGSCA